MSAGTRYVVVGAGIVGLATAQRLLHDQPDATVSIVDKENRVGAHQSTHNSGVLHSGVYYRPGSLKAVLCRTGRTSMVDFCKEHGIPVDICGKLIVATDEAQLPRLHALHERARASTVQARLLTVDEAREYEPAVTGVAALHLPSTGIVDFGVVCEKLAELCGLAGADIRLGTRVTGVRPDGAGLRIQTTGGDLAADVLVNCAGLYADRVARLCGVQPPARIVPFRGEYYTLRRPDLVNALIYPVPDPRLPFLGVHLTRMLDGGVHVGPNAVLALAREGYKWRRVNLRDTAETAGYGGLWRLARRHYRYGVDEVRRSLSRRRFAAAVGELVPAVTPADLVRNGSGVRAQAVRPNGDLVDDFLIVRGHRQLHVLNAPSPAATSSLEIARHIVAQLNDG
jgi:(S)-2-hydroxyglutarate dehydrogenase